MLKIKEPVFLVSAAGLVTGAVILNSLPLALTVKFCVFVAPSAVAVTVAIPEFIPVTVIVSCPLTSVTPEDGVSVTFPVPVTVKVTGMLYTPTPPALLALTVSVVVVGVVPEKSTVEALVSETLEPVI